MSRIDNLQKLLQRALKDAVSVEDEQKNLEDLTKATGDRFTRFEKDKKGDFVRTATTVLSKDGSSFAIGSKLDRTGKAYKKVAAGKSYQGKVDLFGDSQYGSYRLTHDGGVNFVGRNL